VSAPQKTKGKAKSPVIRLSEEQGTSLMRAALAVATVGAEYNFHGAILNRLTLAVWSVLGLDLCAIRRMRI